MIKCITILIGCLILMGCTVNGDYVVSTPSVNYGYSYPYYYGYSYPYYYGYGYSYPYYGGYGWGGYRGYGWGGYYRGGCYR
jgi:hypothetical protein